MNTILLIFHTLLALAIVGLILMQNGKGTGMGAAFGGGSSNTVFGSKGSASFFFKLTSFLTLIFIGTSIALTVFVNRQFTTTSEDMDLALQELEQQSALIREARQDDELPDTSLNLSQAILQNLLVGETVTFSNTSELNFTTEIELDENGILRSTDLALLDKVANTLLEYNQYSLVIREHASDSEAQGQALNIANKIADYLESKGVTPTDLSTEWAGDAESGSTQNSILVEFEFIYN